MARNRSLLLSALVGAALIAPAAVPAGLPGVGVAVATVQPADAPDGVPPPPDPRTGRLPSPEDADPEPVRTAPTPRRAAPKPAPAPGTGPALLEKGDRGRKVTVLQVRLQRAGVYDFPATGRYHDHTVEAVQRFQRKAKFARSGKVDRATQRKLRKRTGRVDGHDLDVGRNLPYVSRLAKACRKGRVLCIDKTAHTVRLVVKGKVRMTLDARFGAPGYRTREGRFQVFRKSRDHVSSLYESQMPFSLFFSGGQAVHYSAEFVKEGYAGGSHGCVNTRQYKKMRKLFDKTHLGDRVIVYRSKKIKG